MSEDNLAVDIARVQEQMKAITRRLDRLETDNDRHKYAKAVAIGFGAAIGFVLAQWETVKGLFK